MYWDDERGHARIGEILGHTDAGGVIRAVDAVTRGELLPGPARWSGWYVDGSPQDAYGIRTEELALPTVHGRAPAWVTRAGDGTRWAVLVHGRGARRGETLRAVPVLTDLGISCIIPSYRNDSDGPGSSDGKYALGLTEWEDVDLALEFALREGARSIDLLGWSMGGAIVMQVLARSGHAGAVRRVVLDGPVLDWADVMAHHARANRLHPRLADLAARLLGGNRSSRRMTGLAQAIDVTLTNWVARAGELTKPMLVIHSVDDEFVPYGPSAELARLRPDIVTWQRWEQARHVREWNTDPARWERCVREFLAR
nr:alpha/beta fold hydrolase [Dermacoccus nishinomiyaensis]